jgi:hypothetical protein
VVSQSHSPRNKNNPNQSGEDPSGDKSRAQEWFEQLIEKRSKS